jgi:hypothetical protein
MCELALESSDWLAVDSWESQQEEYFTTLPVLEHFYNCLNKDLPKVQSELFCDFFVGRRADTSQISLRFRSIVIFQHSGDLGTRRCKGYPFFLILFRLVISLPDLEL